MTGNETMRDVQQLLRAKGIQPVVIERTEPKEGHYFFQGHRVVRMGDPLPVVMPMPEPDPQHPHGRYGQNHPIVTWGWVPVLVIAVVMIGAAVLSAKGIW